MCKRDRIRDKDEDGKTRALCSEGKCRDKAGSKEIRGIGYREISRHLECPSLYKLIISVKQIVHGA